MKSERTIQIEYRQVINQANKLEECAQDIETVKRRLENLIDRLGSGWEGEGAARYLEKCHQLSCKLADTSRNIHATSRVISKAAAAYRAAELAAIELIKN